MYLQSRDAGGVRREGRGAQVASQQGVQGRRHRGMGRFPVGLEVFSEMLAGVLQLVLVQDDVEHFLLAADGQRQEGTRRCVAVNSVCGT